MPPALVVVQARMGSQRLPGKSLATIGGEPLVTIVLRRLLASDVGPVLLATTCDVEDDRLADEAERLGVPAVRGSRDDVLARFVQAVTGTGAEIVIRATADNPAVDIDAPRRAIAALTAANADYCHERDLPYGTVVEAVRTSALIEAAARATAIDDREHVTPFVRRQPAKYGVVQPDAPHALRRPDLRLTVDTEADLAFMRAIADDLSVPLASAPLADIIAAADRVVARPIR
jgi:spore coat polysaccharide biosynthesis protein SpsF (cytidylyltransferase family)